MKCYVCGSEAMINFVYGGSHRQVVCVCGLKGPIKPTTEEAEKAWSRRTRKRMTHK